MSRRRTWVTLASGSGPVLYLGDYTISDAATLAALQPVEHLIGVLRIVPGCPAAVALPKLLSCHQLLVVSNPDVQTLDLPVMAQAGLVQVNSCTGLTALGLGGLANVGTTLAVYSCAALTALNLSALVSTGEGCSVYSCATLPTLDLGALERVGTVAAPRALFVQTVAALTTLPLTSLQRASSVNVTTAPELTGLALPAYVSGSLSVSGAAKLTTLTAPVLQAGGGIDVVSTGVTALAFPALTGMTFDFGINTNAALLSVDFPLLAAVNTSLSMGGISADCSGNSQLQSFEAPSLSQIFCQLQIYSNNALNDLDLTALVRVGTAANNELFRVNLNPQLCDSIVAARTAALIAAGHTGTRTVNGNKGGC